MHEEFEYRAYRPLLNVVDTYRVNIKESKSGREAEGKQEYIESRRMAVQKVFK